MRTILRPLTGKKSGKNDVLGEVVSQKTNDWRGFRRIQCTLLAERNRELAGNFCYEKRAAFATKEVPTISSGDDQRYSVGSMLPDYLSKPSERESVPIQFTK